MVYCWRILYLHFSTFLLINLKKDIEKITYTKVKVFTKHSLCHINHLKKAACYRAFTYWWFNKHNIFHKYFFTSYQYILSKKKVCSIYLYCLWWSLTCFRWSRRSMGPDCCEPGAFGDVRGSCSAWLRLLQKKQDSTLPGEPKWPQNVHLKQLV